MENANHVLSESYPVGKESQGAAGAWPGDHQVRGLAVRAFNRV